MTRRHQRWYKPSKPTAEPKYEEVADVKTYLAEQAGHKCVYCGMHSNQCGGIWYLHIEHYRPKSKFRHLETDLRNLYISCAICNVYKSDDWPGEPLNLHALSYPDPGANDYNEIFAVDVSGRVDSPYRSGKYLVIRLALNRAQLIIERRRELLWSAILETLSRIEEVGMRLTDHPAAGTLRSELAAVRLDAFQWLRSDSAMPLYGRSDTRRPV